MFKQINSQFFNVNSRNGRTEKGRTSCKELNKKKNKKKHLIIKELQAKLAISAAIVDGLRSEVKHDWSRVPKLETENLELRQENLKLRQQNEAITIENDEFKNGLYELVQENEKMVDSLERYERDLLNFKALVRRVSEENESLLREVEELRVSINPNNSITPWTSVQTKSSDDALSSEDREDAKLNAKIIQFQLKKSLNHCLLEIEQIRQENVTLNEERDSWMAQFGAISKEVHEIMRIQSGNNQSMTNGPQFKGFSSCDDGKARVIAHRRISEILSSSGTVRVKGRLAKQLSRKTSNLLGTIEELQTKLAESVAMIECLKSEVKHVRSYYVNRIPKIETENEILHEQNEEKTFENDELANDVYDMIQENEELVVNFERVERDLFNSKALVRNVSEENESLLREVEELRVSINPNNSSTSWFSIKTMNEDALSPEDCKDAKMNAEIVQFQLKKSLNHCLLEIEEMKQENATLREECDSWMEQFDAISKEDHERRDIQNRNRRSMINDSQRSISTFDDGSVRIVAHRRISEILSSSGTMRVKGRLSKRLSRIPSTSSTISTVLDTLEEND